MESKLDKIITDLQELDNFNYGLNNLNNLNTKEGISSVYVVIVRDQFGGLIYNMIKIFSTFDNARAYEDEIHSKDLDIDLLHLDIHN